MAKLNVNGFVGEIGEGIRLEEGGPVFHEIVIEKPNPTPLEIMFAGRYIRLWIRGSHLQQLKKHGFAEEVEGT